MKKLFLGLAVALLLHGAAAAANFSRTATGLLFDMDTRGYAGISLGVGGNAAGHTIVVEANSDPTGNGTWYTILCTPLDGSANPTTNIAAATKGYVCPVPAPRVRARITAIASGTYSVSVSYVGLGVASAAGGSSGGLSAGDSINLATIATAAADTTTKSPVKGSSSSGVLAPIPVPDLAPFLNMTSNTVTKIITGVAAKLTKISEFDFYSDATTNVKLVTGTGTNCGTGTADLTPLYHLKDQGGVVKGNGSGVILPPIAASVDVCASNSATANTSVQIAATQEP